MSERHCKTSENTSNLPQDKKKCFPETKENENLTAKSASFLRSPLVSLAVKGLPNVCFKKNDQEQTEMCSVPKSVCDQKHKDLFKIIAEEVYQKELSKMLNIDELSLEETSDNTTEELRFPTKQVCEDCYYAAQPCSHVDFVRAIHIFCDVSGWYLTEYFEFEGILLRNPWCDSSMNFYGLSLDDYHQYAINDYGIRADIQKAFSNDLRNQTANDFVKSYTSSSNNQFFNLGHSSLSHVEAPMSYVTPAQVCDYNQNTDFNYCGISELRAALSNYFENLLAAAFSKAGVPHSGNQFFNMGNTSQSHVASVPYASSLQLQQPYMNPSSIQASDLQNPCNIHPQHLQSPNGLHPMHLQNPNGIHPTHLPNQSSLQPTNLQNPNSIQPTLVQNTSVIQPMHLQNASVIQSAHLQNTSVIQPTHQNPNYMQATAMQYSSGIQPMHMQNPNIIQAHMQHPRPAHTVQDTSGMNPNNMMQNIFVPQIQGMQTYPMTPFVLGIQPNLYPLLNPAIATSAFFPNNNLTGAQHPNNNGSTNRY